MVYCILKHPEVTRKLRKEVDEVLGDRPMQLSALDKVPYLEGPRTLRTSLSPANV